MQQNRPNAKELSPEEIAHLGKLKAFVEQALNNGKLSVVEIESINAMIWTDGKVTYEELRVVRETVEFITGDSIPEREWQPYKR
ncbi:MAG: hypothetical protein F6K30_09820 [Cyanothece sp. SIO2G6]|nr:hypothetical protein [Cyanothece sp. SIO2G6]